MPIYHPQASPIPPSWPDRVDDERRQHLAVRWKILREDFQKELADYCTTIWAEERAAAVGEHDTSINPLSTWCRQTSTPGLYGSRPTIRGPAEAEALIAPGGLLDAAGWALGGQYRERMTRGLGDTHVAVEVRDGRLTLRLVYPQNIYVLVDPAEPSRALAIWELRLRLLRMPGNRLEQRWCWDVWDVHDPSDPVFTVLDAADSRKDVAGEVGIGLEAGGLRGANYPCFYADGTPFLPYVHYRVADVPDYWCWFEMRPLHGATFIHARQQAEKNFAVSSASIRPTVFLNCTVVGKATLNAGSGGALNSVTLLPGSILHAQGEPDKQAQVVQLGAGAELDVVHRIQRDYLTGVLAHMGLRDADATRTEGNPTSAAALAISDQSRREAQRQLAPLFAAADAELCRMAAARLNREVGLSLPDTAEYAVFYEIIPETTSEAEDRRSQEEHDLKLGLVSRIDLLARRRPGLDRAALLAELRRIRQDEAEIAASTVPTPNPAP